MKIIPLEKLKGTLRVLKRKGKKIVHCHGCFDLMHPGHIKYFQAAKKMGDVLVVTVTPDRYVDKGPGRPVFKEKLRAQSIAALECVDYVSVNRWPTACETLRLLEPDIYVKGQEFEGLEDKTGKIQKESAVIRQIGAKLKFTQEIVFSSTELINNHFNPAKNLLDNFPIETKIFLKRFSSKYNFELIADRINTLQKSKIMIIGDGIIDEYHYCEALGRSSKAPLVVQRYLSHEVFAGGVFAIANHISGFCDNVHLVSLLGGDSAREDFIRSSLRRNITSKFFYKGGASTIVKKRYLSQYLNQKLFEVNYLNDNQMPEGLEKEIIDYLRLTLPAYDLVLISDYGHNFITDKIIKVIEGSSNKFAVNTQTNAANAGYNMITKYLKPTYVCLDEPEARLAMQKKYEEVEIVAEKILREIGAGCLIVTLGKKGSFGINNKKVTNRTPIFSSKVIDTVGAGDAFFAYTAPCLALGMPLDLVSFIGNAVGALAVQIVCNKRSVEKYELLEFIHALLKQAELCDEKKDKKIP